MRLSTTCPAKLHADDRMIKVHTTAGPMQPLRALPRVVPTQRAHEAIHTEAEVRRPPLWHLDLQRLNLLQPA